MPEESTDKKHIAISLINSFCNEITNLTHNYTVYENQLMYITKGKKQYTAEDLDMNEETKVEILNTLSYIRSGIVKCNIFYQSLCKSINANGEKVKLNLKISELSKKMRAEYLIKFEMIDEFVIELNNFLIEDVIQHLINMTQQIIEDGQPQYNITK